VHGLLPKFFMLGHQERVVASQCRITVVSSLVGSEKEEKKPMISKRLHGERGGVLMPTVPIAGRD